MTYTPQDDRYQKLPYRRCGNRGLKLPTVSLGCWHNFGGAGTGSNKITDEAGFHENCRQMLFTAFDHGITHFDIANNYGPPPGSAEERVGRIMKEDLKNHRDELIISTKAGFTMWPGPYGDWGSRKYLLSSLDQSLKRLGMDYVDIFYHHRPDPETSLEETMGALDSAVRSGKALYAGLSNYSGDRTAEALEVCERHGFMKPVIHQPSYSMLNRHIEHGLLPTTKRLGIGIIAFCPLQQGLLTDKYLHGIPDDSRAASKHGFLKPEAVQPEVVAKVRKLHDVAQQRGQTLAQMALSWALRDEGVTTVLIGASRPEQISENVAAPARAAFDASELQRIDEILGS